TPPGSVSNARTVIVTAMASTMKATAKCSVTTAGSSLVAMIHPPIAAWITKSGARTTASHAAARGTTPRHRGVSDHPPTTASAIERDADRTARNRWRYSITVWYSRRGTHAPKHRG